MPVAWWFRSVVVPLSAGKDIETEQRQRAAPESGNPEERQPPARLQK